MMFVLGLLVLAATEPNLLSNPSFEEGLAGWDAAAPHVTMEAGQAEGRSVARISVPGDAPVAWPTIGQRVPVAPEDLLSGTAEVCAQGIRDGYGAYLALEFYDASGQRMSYGQSAGLLSDDAWKTLRVRAVAPGGAVSARLCLIVNGRGDALFDNARLVRLENLAVKPLDGEVSITVTNDVACANLVGFGAEDDGWFYAPENLDRGIDEGDIALRERRLEWLEPDWVRMFCWYKDWNPSGDWKTFTFDSPNMQSHYRTLALYQRLGALVNVTGVEWGVADPFGRPEEMARAVGALFEHLIRDKGFACVRQWTLTNEPNTHFLQLGYSFDRYVELHRLAKEEFGRRGLDIQIVGSDDTGGLEWFEACAGNDSYFAVADVFASHRYFPFADRVLAPYFFEERLDVLARKTPRKPLVVAEFGFQDGRSGTFANPIMEDYPYALWTFNFIVEGLNRGVAGFNIWCLHEVYYPGGNMMNYGLWNSKDRGWAIRPVYHAIACFTRMTEPGAAVRRCESSHPRHAAAAVVGNVAFWVNQAGKEAPIRFDLPVAGPARAYTRETVKDEHSPGLELRVQDNAFTAPPESFGFVKLGD